MHYLYVRGAGRRVRGTKHSAGPKQTSRLTSRERPGQPSDENLDGSGGQQKKTKKKTEELLRASAGVFRLGSACNHGSGVGYLLLKEDKKERPQLLGLASLILSTPQLHVFFGVERYRIAPLPATGDARSPYAVLLD